MLYSFRPWCTAAVKGDSISANYFIVTAILLVLSTGLLLSHFLRRKQAPLPPGPTGLPLVGYLPFLGPHLHREFTALAATYGPIYSLRLGTKLCAVVSSPSLAKEIVRDMDAVFSDRDPPISALVLMYGGHDVAFSNYGPVWKKLRKVFVREMYGVASREECYGLRKQQVRNSVKEVYKRSSGAALDFGETAFKTTANAILSMLWGGVAGNHEGFYGELRELESEMLMLMGAPNVSDFIPALARFDLQGIEKKSKRLLSKFDEILSSAIEERLRAVEKSGGTVRKDFLQVLLDLNRGGGSDGGETYISTNQVKALLMDFMVGGTDTTSTMMEWTMAQLVKYPDAMAKVYQELNEVVGQNEIVEESHLPKLNYLEAVIKETLRLHPALPFLVPRCPSQTCELGGYTIPKGTIVYLNAYAIHTDPQLWEDPLEFKPDRFLEDDTKFDFQGNNFQFLPFGSGRRVCPAQRLAVNTIKYELATLLHSFDWKLPPETELELSDKFGFVIKKMNPLVLVPTPRLSNLELY
ncbi:unnamed protein product [Linum trigynum]|uniref:Cytochrome P450 n=1 Tax=Linum trigynum TaxID=586398 RepID=A0AAV2DQ11_9ROSI